MRKFLTTCISLLTCTALLHAQPLQKKLQLDLATGYERQNLNWSIAGNSSGQSPNIYSELKWKKVGGQSISAAMQWNFWNKLSLMADYSKVFIKSGSVTDNDYNGDNRTDRVYDQTFDADEGNTRAWSAGLGYVLVNNENFSFTPYVGYCTSGQSLHLLDRSGQFADLNSTYGTDWKGPFIKATASARLLRNLKLASNVTYNQADYKAKADWNLIPTFQHPVSYRHTAKGYGLDANASVVYAITKNLGVNLGGGYFTWQTGEGVDELYLSSGGSDKTQLNGVSRTGYRLFAGATFSFE